MNILLVIIRSSDTTDASFCQNQLSQIGEVTALTEESFLVLTTQTATEVRDMIKSIVMPSRIFVTKVTHGAAWANVLTSNATIKDWYHFAE